MTRASLARPLSEAERVRGCMVDRAADEGAPISRVIVVWANDIPGRQFGRGSNCNPRGVEADGGRQVACSFSMFQCSNAWQIGDRQAFSTAAEESLAGCTGGARGAWSVLGQVRAAFHVSAQGHRGARARSQRRQCAIWPWRWGGAWRCGLCLSRLRSRQSAQYAAAGRGSSRRRSPMEPI